MNFEGFEFGNRADFSNCKWQIGASASGLEIFLKIASDGKAFAPGRACFTGAAFDLLAKFTGATFGEFADFTSATFGIGADFTGTAFGHSADFGGAVFGLAANFTGVNFEDAASFEDAVFGDDAIYDGTSFAGAVTFEGVAFGWQTRACLQSERGYEDVDGVYHRGEAGALSRIAQFSRQFPFNARISFVVQTCPNQSLCQP